MGVMKHLAEFLRMLSVPCRLSFLPMLQDILNTTNPFNWRLRQSLALQLPELIDLPPIENLYSSLYPLITSLLQDSIVSVRRCSYKGVAKLINVLAAEAEREMKTSADSGKPSITEAQLEDVAGIINMLAHGDSYNMRLVWVELCHTLLRELPQTLFEKYFLEGVLLLTSDKTTNIRIAVATLLGGWAPLDLAPWESPNPTDWQIYTLHSYSFEETDCTSTNLIVDLSYHQICDCSIQWNPRHWSRAWSCQSTCWHAKA
jgi:hypothetical protein